MSRIITIFLVFLTGTMFSTLTTAASKRPADVWNYYHFDGAAFAPGPAAAGTAFVAVREKVQPVVLTTEAVEPESVVLPDGSGVIAGICYLQSSGGKLGNNRSFQPCPHIPLLIYSAGKQLVTVQTDEHGYFVVVLPAGAYSVSNGPFAIEIAVERGITTLVPLRAGKRMVD